MPQHSYEAHAQCITTIVLQEVGSHALVPQRRPPLQQCPSLPNNVHYCVYQHLSNLEVNLVSHAHNFCSCVIELLIQLSLEEALNL